MTPSVTFGEEREHLVSTIYTQPALVSVTRQLSQVLVEWNKGMWKASVEATLIIAYNRPFPLRHNGKQNTWRHAWCASEGLLGRILHCYIWEHDLRSNSCCFLYRGKYRAALTPIKSSSIGLFNSVDRIPSDFVWHWTERLGTGGITIGEWSCRAS